MQQISGDQHARPKASATMEGVGSGRVGVGPVIVTGLVIIVLFFGGFGSWAALAPLDSAAIAPGVVSVAGNRKTIQHLEGAPGHGRGGPRLNRLLVFEARLTQMCVEVDEPGRTTFPAASMIVG